jgi:hypothetical protein
MSVTESTVMDADPEDGDSADQRADRLVGHLLR